MVIKTFTSTNLEKCLEDASNKLSIPIEELKYEIKGKSGFLKKSITIDVFIEGLDGLAWIENGKIFVKNPKPEGNPATIVFGNDIDVKVDGEAIKSNKPIYTENIIDIEIPKSEGKRILNVKISKDSMEAYAEIVYEPACIFSLEDESPSNILSIKKKVEKEIYPESFTKEYILEKLNELGVTYGIQHEEIEKNLKNKEKLMKFTVAKGLEKIDGKDDTINLHFKDDDKTYKEDDKGRIDYKNVGKIISVRTGEVLAEKIYGEEGKDGYDVHGNVLKHKDKNKITMKVSKGCKLTDDEKVIALEDGKPSFKNGTFQVSPIHEVNGDITLKTGNINYKGNIVINGNVEEGMKVEAGNDVLIYKNVTAAKILSKARIEILGNVILSEIRGGGEDTEKTSYIELVEILSSLLKEVIDVMIDIKRHNFVKDGSTDGQIIKALFENKFKKIPKICSEILKHSFCDSEINKIILRKLNALAPITIKHFGELNEYVKVMDDKVAWLKQTLNEPADVKISYCQDSNIESTGSVYISGKGEYVSNIVAQGSIYFEDSSAVVRGGVIKAKTEIKCSTVGSLAGVVTKLIVEKHGHIFANIAYPNTKFQVGVKEYTLDVSSKDVHAYLDSLGDIVVDKLML